MEHAVCDVVHQPHQILVEVARLAAGVAIRPVKRRGAHAAAGNGLESSPGSGAQSSVSSRDSAVESSFAVTSTIGITRSYAMRVGPMTPSVPMTVPLTS